MTTQLPEHYPSTWDADVALRDGSIAHIRPIRPDDADRIRQFHAGQSEESIYLRFFAPLRTLSDRDVHRFTNVDYRDRVALVCIVRGDIAGIGRYDVVEPGVAEVAFNISDRHQGRGIGSVLLEHLAAIGQEQGVFRFVAEVLPNNRKMLSVFADAGYDVTRRVEDGIVQVSFDIHPTTTSREVSLAREHRAEAESIEALMHPGAIAVFGASRDEGTLGHRLLSNILRARFQGSLVVVHPEADEVHGVPAVRSLADSDASVDLALIAVPAEVVLDVVDHCADHGVKSVVIISAGFAETGPEGQQLQAEVLRRARSAGMRVVGPNSLGMINNDPRVQLNASVAPHVPPVGQLGLFAQSGALGLAVLATASRRRLGVSAFASAGNRVDVSGNDFMQYWIDDPATSAVGLYLESMGNPRKFSRIARNLAQRKPVIVVNTGVSAYGAPGHRVRRTTTSPQAFKALLQQAGVIRVDSVHRLFDVAQLVVHQPLPLGHRVAVVGNAVGLSALAAGRAVAEGLVVSHGPVTLPTEATPEQFSAVLDDAFADEDVDAVVCCFTPPLRAYDEDVIEAVRSHGDHPTKPLLATLLGLRGLSDSGDIGADTGAMTTSSESSGSSNARVLPLYAMPEDAMHALSLAANYSSWLRRERGERVAPSGIDRTAAEGLVAQVLADSPQGRALSAEETQSLLASYGISVWPAIRVTTSQEAVSAAERLGYPVVVKSLSPVARNQPGLVAVRVDLDTASEVEAAWQSLHEWLPVAATSNIVVQRMASPGNACLISSTEDPLFGPLVSFSVAGAPTELYQDVGYAVPPLTSVEVADLVTGVTAAPLLFGTPDIAPADRHALEDLVARVSVLADHIEELAEVRLDPVNVHAGGVDVLGASVRLAPATKRKDAGRRSLT